MTTVALTAHFDGEKVQFDEPASLTPMRGWWLWCSRRRRNARMVAIFSRQLQSLRQQRAGYTAADFALNRLSKAAIG